MLVMDSETLDLACSWEEDRKFILRGWSLVFSTLATLMSLSVMEGRMAYLEGPYTGYLGIWTNCRKHECASLGKVTVLLHMSTGFMVLVMALSLVLLSTMGLSFLAIFRRLNKVDAIFSFLSFSIGLSGTLPHSTWFSREGLFLLVRGGFLIILSLLLFVVTCETLHPKPRVNYMLTSYLCWAGGALMLWAGALSYLNHVGMWSEGKVMMDRRVSYRRWVSQQSVSRRKSKARSCAEARDSCAKSGVRTL